MSAPIDRYRQLAAEVSELRPNIVGRENASGYLALFDEFVRECELGLALHAVCDYLLESGSPRPGPSVIERIDALHRSMKIQDDCVDRLRQRAGSEVSLS
jgi:hypothetical protein